MKPKTGNTQQTEQAFLDSVKQALDDSVEQVDELTRAKLSAARHRAVDAASQSARWNVGNVLSVNWFDRRGAVIAGVFSIAVIAVLVLPNLTAQNPQQAVALIDDMELLGGADDLDFYQDLDFYLWVADEQVSG